MEYWRTRNGKVGHEEVYKGRSTYMMQQVGNLRHCIIRQRARRVKLMLDCRVHGRRMQLIRLDDSGKCTVCMATDLLEHIMFDSNYSAAVHERQDWISGIKVMLQRHHRQPQTKTWRQDDASVDVYSELQDIFIRHPYKQFLW
jgi:hypothetical protein